MEASSEGAQAYGVFRTRSISGWHIGVRNNLRHASGCVKNWKTWEIEYPLVQLVSKPFAVIPTSYAMIVWCLEKGLNYWYPYLHNPRLNDKPSYQIVSPKHLIHRGMWQGDRGEATECCQVFSVRSPRSLQRVGLKSWARRKGISWNNFLKVVLGSVPHQLGKRSLLTPVFLVPWTHRFVNFCGALLCAHGHDCLAQLTVLPKHAAQYSRRHLAWLYSLQNRFQD